MNSDEPKSVRKRAKVAKPEPYDRETADKRVPVTVPWAPNFSEAVRTKVLSAAVRAPKRRSFAGPQDPGARRLTGLPKALATSRVAN